MNPVHDLAAALRSCRSIAGLTQEQLAARLGCATSTVQRAERGQSVPRADLLASWTRITAPQRRAA